MRVVVRVAEARGDHRFTLAVEVIRPRRVSPQLRGLEVLRSPFLPARTRGQPAVSVKDCETLGFSAILRCIAAGSRLYLGDCWYDFRPSIQRS